MSRHRRNTLLALALMTGLVAACDETTGPEVQATFDAEGALQDYEAMEAILKSNVMAGFRAMGPGVSFETFGPAPVMTLGVAANLMVPGSEATARAFAGRMAQVAAALPREPSRSPVISPWNRGKVFAYDAALGRYAHDPSLTDGPANGVRWILYEDDGTGKPDPARQIGHADLIDQGDGSVEDIALALIVVVDDETRLEYRTTLDVLESGGKITVDGFIRGEDPADRLDFDIDVEGSEGTSQSSLDISFAMWINSRDFRIEGSVLGMHVGADETGEIDLSVRHGDESLRIAATGSESTIDGTFYLNDEVFATVYGNPGDPTFEGASGEPLTWAEALVLHHMVDIAEDIFDLFEDLLDPIDELVILAVIL
ncbi:hypothetical protein ACFL3S_05735 [Gemmatimonadota bacterium]